MKAIVCTAYGPPELLQLQGVGKPVPRGNEVLIRVHATTVHRGDSRMRGLDIPGPGWQRLLARLVLGIRRPRKAIEEATLIPCGGVTTLGILKRANIQPGQQVLIYGASGIYLNVHASSDKIKGSDAPLLLSELKELIEAGKLKAFPLTAHLHHDILAGWRLCLCQGRSCNRIRSCRQNCTFHLSGPSGSLARG